jgi:hypothetical protein
MSITTCASFHASHPARSSASCIDAVADTDTLELLVDSGCIPSTKMAELLDETRQLIAIFTAIDKRSKQDHRGPKTGE